MLKTKFISSLDKPFTDESFDNYSAISKITALKGERVSFQLLYTNEKDEVSKSLLICRTELCGSMAKYAAIRELKSVAVHKPVGGVFDDNYLRTSPGIYPDLLYPLPEGGHFAAARPALTALSGISHPFVRKISTASNTKAAFFG